MSATPSQSALALLQYLHEHTGASGGRIALDPKPVMRALRVGAARFAEDSASLAAQGLVGVREYRPNAHGVPSGTCSAIWVTGKGQDYVRRSQAGPGRTRVAGT